MRNNRRLIWGILLLVAGIIFLLNALNITDIDILFPGWWTLFIIIPNLIGIFTERDKIGNLFGLGVGVLLLLWQQDVFDFDFLWKICVAAFIIYIAVKIIISSFGKKEKSVKIEINGDVTSDNVIFSAKENNFAGQVFEGYNTTVVFGGLEIDLRDAIIEKDCVINAVTIFGGIDILLPENVNLKVDTVGIFGGVENTHARPSEPSAVMVCVQGAAIFGGVDVK